MAVCKKCKDMIDNKAIEKYPHDKLRQEVQSCLTPTECKKMVTKIENNPSLFIVNVSYDPLCKHFYMKDCVGCPFKRFSTCSDVGCRRYFKVRLGDATDITSNMERLKLYTRGEI